MLLIRLWRYLKGYLVVWAEGKGSERLINLAVTRGINFWDLKKSYRGAMFRIPAKSFKQTRPLVRMSGCRVRIHRKRGMPFFIRKIRRRKGFAAGIIVFIIAVYVSASFVWFVEFSGLNNISEDEMLRIARSVGIKPGAYKGGLDLDKLEKELARLHREIAWVGLSYRGTLLRVEVAEHIPEPVIDERPADIVASKDGLILNVLAIEGKPVVSPGDLVSAGELLIKGVKVISEEILMEDEELKPEAVRARGEVRARVWYEARRPVVREEVIKSPTGQKKTHVYIRWGSGTFRLKGSDKRPFSVYFRDVVKWNWSWRNLSLPVELIIMTYNELDIKNRILPVEEAVSKATDEAKKAVLDQIPGGAVTERMFFEEQLEGDYREIRAVVETREDIGEYRLIK